MKLKNLFLVLVGLGLVIQYACSDDDETPNTNNNGIACDSALNATYNGMVGALINANCNFSGCHNSGGAGGIKLTNYAEVKAAAMQDRFLKSIKHEAGGSPMPKNGVQFSERNVLTFECWIQNGYLES